MWHPPIALTSEEQIVAAHTRKTRKFFVFLREHRHELLDADFQHLLGHRSSPERGHSPRHYNRFCEREYHAQAESVSASAVDSLAFVPQRINKDFSLAMLAAWTNFSGVEVIEEFVSSAWSLFG